MRHMFREMLLAAFTAGLAVQVAFGAGHPDHGLLAQATLPTVPLDQAIVNAWTMAVWLDMLILGAIGLAGGFLSLIAIPFRSPHDAILRVFCGGIFSSLFAGALIVWAGLGNSHPSVRCAIAGLSGFLSYPALMWTGQNGLAWALKRLGVEATMKDANPPTTTTPPSPAPAPQGD